MSGTIPTYHQILAEQYEENATILLVEPNLHEEDQVEPHDTHNHDELEDKEDFNRNIGSHALAALAPSPVKQPNLTKNSLEYDRQIITRLINIDSRYRPALDDGTFASTSSNFVYVLRQPVKNVISVRISSIELPNVFYAFSAARGNTNFLLTFPSILYTSLPTGYSNRFSGQLQIQDGNYDLLGGQTDLTVAVASVINTQLATSFPATKPTFTVTLNSLTRIVTITSVSGLMFDIDFGSFNNRAADFGLGYNLGFRTKIWMGETSIPPNVLVGQTNSFVPNSIINVTDTNYIFLTLNPDWKVVIHDNPDRVQTYSFAKVIIDQPKNAIVYDNGQKTITREFTLRQPTNIINIPVRLSDPYDQDIDLVGVDFSFSLEVKEVVNASLYEAMRT